MENYFLGLDTGTDSVGWAVTDEKYNVMKFKGNAMWGVRLFDESNTAEERRFKRTSRRRTERSRERLALLEEIFNEKISETDPAFFQRLRESNLYIEDKQSKTRYAVFADSGYTDIDFHKAYPTVYHLRKELIQNPAQHDVRLVFLALHHIIKHRGHFLFDSLSIAEIDSFDSVFGELCLYLKDNYDIEASLTNSDELQEVLKSKRLGKTLKTEKILELCSISKKENKQAAEILKALSGASVKPSVIFDDPELDKTEANVICFSDKYDEKEEILRDVLDDRFELIANLKAIYDWGILENILCGNQYLSFGKVEVYEKHRSDLLLLKKYVRRNCKDLYNEIFKLSKDGLCNYVAYSGRIKQKGKNGILLNKCTQVDFCSYLKKVLPNNGDPKYSTLFSDIETNSLMPKQVSKDNSVIPMQLNRVELIKILNNAAGYLPFLSEKDSCGYSAYDKIVSLFDYRIPYYVGPLNPHSDKAWLVRTNEKIFPWNFDKVVDVDASAEKFIENLTSKCTYLPDKDVIPKSSVLYSRFMVLNELNNLKIDGQKISVEMKKELFINLFLSKKKVTQRALRNYLLSKGYQDFEITGIDEDFKSNMKSFIDLRMFSLSEDEMDEIIKAITIFGDDKKLLKKRLTMLYGNKLCPEDINKISRYKFSGWGALSKEFLTEIYGIDKRTGERLNIISALWETNDNLMMLLGSSFTFADVVKEAVSYDGDKSMRELVEGLYVSPKVKRPIYQSLKIVNEIVKIKGCAPKKIFIEVARGPEEKKRTVSRKGTLLALYKKCKAEAEELYSSLEGIPDERLKGDKLYLYYTQLGRCMYTGEHIDLDRFNDYDIDHIYPQSKIKDDSLDNRVLVKKTFNADKDNEYPLKEEIRSSRLPYWKMLLEKGLISKKKFERLTRNYPLSDSELSDFIARQLVETRQSTKAVAQLLGQMYPSTEIVYSKAGLVSDFRRDYDMLKCRDVNDLHHAKDAYLNIVVGNVYNVKCTHNKANFIRGLQTKQFSLNKMFNFNTPGAWTVDGDESISVVKNTMFKNNVLYTRYSYIQHGELFKQQILKKGSGQVPIKANSPRSDIEKYGGYDKPKSAYFSFVEYTDKKARVRALIPIDLYLVKEFEADRKSFLETHLGLSEPKIVIACVKYGSCISFDGFRMHLSAKTNDTIQYKPGMQLVLGYDLEKYIRNISKFVSGKRPEKINSQDEITKEQNLALFDSICDKMQNSVFKIRCASSGKALSEKREKFISLSAEEQCKVIMEILNITQTNVRFADLTSLGLVKSFGTSVKRISRKISELKGIESVELVNQSVTGLFENKTRLK